LLFSLISADRCGKERARYDSEHDLFHGVTLAFVLAKTL
jgi:hypothetical protein